MNYLLRKLARSVWRISVPISRPVVRKFDHHMMRLFGSISSRSDTPADLDLTMNSVVLELARLQIQVEILQQHIEDLQLIDLERMRREGGLSLVGEIGGAQ
jgi:hypothetical protein